MDQPVERLLRLTSTFCKCCLPNGKIVWLMSWFFAIGLMKRFGLSLSGLGNAGSWLIISRYYLMTELLIFPSLICIFRKGPYKGKKWALFNFSVPVSLSPLRYLCLAEQVFLLEQACCYVYIYKYICIYSDRNAYIHIHISMYIYTRVNTYIRACICMSMCLYVHAKVYMLMGMYA